MAVKPKVMTCKNLNCSLHFSSTGQMNALGLFDYDERRVRGKVEICYSSHVTWQMLGKLYQRAGDQADPRFPFFEVADTA